MKSVSAISALESQAPTAASTSLRAGWGCRGRGSARGGGRGLLREPLDQPAGHPGREQQSPAATTYGGDEVIREGVLEQEAARARAQCFEHVLVEVEHGEEQHRSRQPVVSRDAAGASSPSISGMRMSMRMTSGTLAHELTRLGAVRRPRRRPRAVGRRSRTAKPLRTSAWSSATATRIARRRPVGEPRGHTESAAGARAASRCRRRHADRSRMPMRPWPPALRDG